MKAFKMQCPQFHQQNFDHCTFLSLTLVCQPKETIPSTFFKYGNNLILTDTQQTEMAASVALPAIMQICRQVEGKVVTRQYNVPVILV